MSEAPPIAPSPFGALVLTAFAWSVLVLVVMVVSTPTERVTLGVALGMLLGFGGAGTLAARALPPPADRRIGLVGFPPHLLLPLALLVPVVLLASELDNQVAEHLFPAGKAALPDAALGPLETLEGMLFGALLRPVLEEFFFRGVVQQGVVAALGRAGGVLLTATLFALVRASLFVGNAYLVTSFGLQALGIGVLLGFVRLATGSILPGVLLLSAIGSVGTVAVALDETLPIPGFNTDGAHTPASFLLPAALSVAAGLYLLARHARPTR